jgi:hypothetical protein
MRTTGNDKIIQILKRIDDILQRRGENQYQERLHRISKTLLSIEKHNNCLVSRFSVEHKNEEVVGVEVIQFDEKQNSCRKNSTKPELEDILEYIEDELNMTREDSSTLNSSSSGEDKEGHPVNLQRRFMKIETKLVSYLKHVHQEIGDINESNNKLMRTAISKLQPRFHTTTRIIKNFFEDREVIESTGKRRSLFDTQKEQLEKLEAIQKICKSNLDKLSFKDDCKDTLATQRISDFNDEVAVSMLLDVSSKGSSFNFAKRDSIFAERRSGILNPEKIAEQLRDVSELISDDDSDDSDDEC